MSLGLYREPSAVDLRFRTGLAVMRKVLVPELPVDGVPVRADGGVGAAGGNTGGLPENREEGSNGKLWLRHHWNDWITILKLGEWVRCIERRVLCLCTRGQPNRAVRAEQGDAPVLKRDEGREFGSQRAVN